MQRCCKKNQGNIANKREIPKNRIVIFYHHKKIQQLHQHSMQSSRVTSMIEEDNSKIILRTTMSLLCSFTVPLNRFSLIFNNPSPFRIG